MTNCTDDEFVKTLQLMTQLGITVSLWGNGKGQTQIIIDANHLYDVLTSPAKQPICDIIANYSFKNLSLKSFNNSISSNKEKFEKATSLFTMLGIPFEAIMHYPGGIIDCGSVSAYDLYDIFSDKEKLQYLIDKLKKWHKTF